MTELTLDEVKQDIKSIEYKFQGYIKISKLIWENGSLVPRIILTKKQGISDDDMKIILNRIEDRLNDLYLKYLDKYPNDREKYETFKKR